MKHQYKVFFAIPFDRLTQHVYETICRELRESYATQGVHLTTIIGNASIGPSQEYLEILSFRYQNTDLHEQFYKQIENAHIVVADLTNNNPNVHIELGIALALDKNILRLTGRPVKELGFDIQNLEVHTYKDQSDLVVKIRRYIDMFIKIKKLGFSEEYRDLYSKIPKPIPLPGTPAEVKDKSLWFYPLPDRLLRDGAVKFKIEFLHNLNADSWAGIYFRAPSLREILSDSYLLYCRKNGKLELGVYPGPEVSILGSVDPIATPDGQADVLLEIENDELLVTVNGAQFTVDGLKKQRAGSLVFACWECQARLSQVEIIKRDTIARIDS
jgi:hypothetical protein